MGDEAKTCSKCGCTKPFVEFSRRGRGYQSHCKHCASTYVRQHYRNNRKYYLEKNRLKQERLTEIIRAAKSRPCADCGQVYPYYVMDFDHIAEEGKVAEISRLIHSRSIRRVSQEIAKCEVVCANCHRLRTFARQQKKMATPS